MLVLLFRVAFAFFVVVIPPKMKVLLRAMYANWNAQSAGLACKWINWMCFVVAQGHLSSVELAGEVTKLRITNRSKTNYATAIETKTKAIKLSLRDCGKFVAKEKKPNEIDTKKGFCFRKLLNLCYSISIEIYLWTFFLSTEDWIDDVNATFFSNTNLKRNERLPTIWNAYLFSSSQITNQWNSNQPFLRL